VDLGKEGREASDCGGGGKKRAAHGLNTKRRKRAVPDDPGEKKCFRAQMLGGKKGEKKLSRARRREIHFGHEKGFPFITVTVAGEGRGRNLILSGKRRGGSCMHCRMRGGLLTFLLWADQPRGKGEKNIVEPRLREEKKKLRGRKEREGGENVRPRVDEKRGRE